MSSTHQFLDALTRRDFDALEASLAPDVLGRLLLPRRVEELHTRSELRARIEGWFGGATDFEVLVATEDAIAGRARLMWRFRLVRDAGDEVIEQVAFADSGDAGVVRLDLLCSGFLATERVDSCAVNVFDAGTMGCSDGLAQEFRRRITSVPVGASLVTIARDPAAKEDLPPLARLLGHAVRSVEPGDDGTIKIVVERMK